MLEFIIAIIGLICAIMMINAAFRLGNRVAIATEASQLLFACNVKDQCWFNGKACRRMGDDEWHKFFPEDERYTNAPTHP